MCPCPETIQCKVGSKSHGGSGHWVRVLRPTSMSNGVPASKSGMDPVHRSSVNGIFRAVVRWYMVLFPGAGHKMILV